MFIYCFHICYRQLRREGDSNPRYPLGVYTLSRRASSTTRASLLINAPYKSGANYKKNANNLRFQLQMYSFFRSSGAFSPFYIE